MPTWALWTGNIVCGMIVLGLTLILLSAVGIGVMFAWGEIVEGYARMREQIEEAKRGLREVEQSRMERLERKI